MEGCPRHRSRSRGDSFQPSNGDEATAERIRRIGRADGSDSDLPNGRREMSSDTNQMIHNNNSNLEGDNQQRAARGTNKSAEPVTANGGQRRKLPTLELVGDTPTPNPQESETRRQAAAFIASAQPDQHRQQQQAQYRAKFTKSKSSPSSLTTHKFGLRPTPSPPRLIIDHQTGDIVESYPEHPVYLRTYQPIEPDDEADETPSHQLDRSTSPAAAAAAAAVNFETLSRQPMNDSSLSIGDESYSDQSRPNHFLHHQQNYHRTPHQMPNVPPPPHAAAKVYFAPPATNSSPFGDQPPPPGQPVSTPSSRERARASFRRAINQLADTAERTDIAIVTEPDDYDRAMHDQGQVGAKPLGQMRVTATSASKGEALLAQQKRQLNQQQQQQPIVSSGAANKLYSQPSLRRTTDKRGGQHQKKQQSSNGKKGQHEDTVNQPPAIEDFNLYSFCYCLRVLLVLLLSGSIIYLLVVNLHEDCLKYRPSSTYVSIITSSVNIISVTIFTLFWYCNGVTRTLYQNISASAFIVTMYTILVCINLALAILFFFIDTCHFQKVIATHSALADWERFSQPLTDESDGGGLVGAASRHERAKRQHDERVALEAISSIERLLDNMQAAHNSRRQHSRRETNTNRREALNDDPNVIDDQIGDPDQEQPTPPSTTSATTSSTTTDPYTQDSYERVPQMSPIEAAWRYLKERARTFAHGFFRFLVHYDLKFIGALHALLAACFQYLAIKVAVVRSYFSSSSGLVNF